MLAPLALAPLLLMFLVAAWGFLTLPPQARVPVHFGIGGANAWWGRTAGLLLYPGVGVLISLFELMVAAPSRTGAGVVALPMGLILVLILTFQVMALNRARRGPTA